MARRQGQGPSRRQIILYSTELLVSCGTEASAFSNIYLKDGQRTSQDEHVVNVLLTDAVASCLVLACYH